MLLLASATDKSSRLFAETLPWLLLLLGVVIVGGVIILLARRHVNRGADSPSSGFTLHDLREMHKAGELSDEEFVRAKTQMIGRLAAEKHAANQAAGDAPTGNPPIDGE